MKILIAEDDSTTLHILKQFLTKWGYEPVVAADGNAAWEEMQKEDPPSLLILDWLMPGIDGLELCRRAHERSPENPPYVIMLTIKGATEDVVLGLQTGADAYLIKPFAYDELQARIQAGIRIVRLQSKLADRVKELEQAIAQVRQLRGLLPICSYCKRVRKDNQDYWQQVEAYIVENSDLQFSHGICPTCYEQVVLPELNEIKRNPE